MNTKVFQLLILSCLVGLLSAQGQCIGGRWMDANNLCQPCPSLCATCQNANYCTTCTANNFLVVGSGEVMCKPCSTVQIGCSVCLTNVACETCQWGFVNENNTCIACDQKITNCSNCSVVNNTATCSQCRYPYILSNNTCISSTVDAITAGVQTVYVQQTNGSNLPFVRLDSGALTPASITTDGCNQYQVFLFNRCVRLIYQCLVYQENGLCKICHNGYLRTIYGDCAVETYIMQCEDGYWRDAANDRCVKVDVSCDWYFPSTGKCFNCSSNYNMQNGSCVPNKKCTNREFFHNGSCVSVPLACLTFLGDGTCTSCASGNTLKNGACTPSLPAVRAWNDCVFPCSTCFFGELSYCFSCRFGYQLRNHRYGTCVPIVF